MNTHWIYSMPGSLATAAFLAWPMSEQDSLSLYDRVRFCLFSMLGFALLVWGLKQQPNGFHMDMDFLTVDGLVIAMMATTFLILLWVEKVNAIMADLALGCIDCSDNSQCDSNFETRQIEEAVQLYRRGEHHRAMCLCNRIIESNSQYSSAATTLAYWIENPGTLRFNKPPRTKLVFKGSFADLNSLLAV